MITRIIQDKYNAEKFWLITKTKSGHYGLIQRVKGQDVANEPRFGLKRIKETLDWAF